MVRRSRLQSAVSLLLILAPSLAAAQGIESPRTPLRTALNEVATVRSEYADAFARNDVKALAGVYTADAVIITGDGAMASGGEQIRQLHPVTEESVGDRAPEVRRSLPRHYRYSI